MKRIRKGSVGGTQTLRYKTYIAALKIV